MYPGKFYFEENSFKLIDNDTFDTLKEFEEKSFDMIFADPPYFLSNDGITCSGGHLNVFMELKLIFMLQEVLN